MSKRIHQPDLDITAEHRHTAFTMIELILITMIMIIAAAMVIPVMSDSDTSRLNVAVMLMIADLDYAQTQAINVPSELILVRFDSTKDRWWVATESEPETPLVNPINDKPFDTTMGIGRAAQALNVTFTLNEITENSIAYDAFGRLSQAINPTITLFSGTQQATITIDAETGFLTAQ